MTWMSGPGELLNLMCSQLLIIKFTPELFELDWIRAAKAVKRIDIKIPGLAEGGILNQPREMELT